MIQISVKDTFDKNYIGQYSIHKNLIYIGIDKGCDVCLEDTGIQSNHIFIEIVEKSKLLCHLGKSTDFILVNSKRTTGHKFLKVGDTIKIGDNSLLTIDAFLFQENLKYKDMLNTKTEAILETDKDLVQIMKAMQHISL